MKKKKEKIAFGILKDGLTIRIAQLNSVKGKIKIKRLEETVLSAPLYSKKSPEIVEKLKLTETKEDISEISEYDGETFNMPEISELDKNREVRGIESEEKVSGIRELQELVRTFPLEKGEIALSADDEQMSHYHFDKDSLTSQLRKKLEEDILSKEERKTKECVVDYIINPDKSILSFAHIGKFELLDALHDINPLLSKKKYRYSYIDANEISLMNLVRNNYDFPPEDYVLILYFDIEYRVGIVMKGGSHVKTFPIIITQTNLEEMIRAIYSKVMLEQDLSDIPITQHVVIAGENICDEYVEFFKENLESKSTVCRIELKNIDISEIEGDEHIPEKIARFAIPIALAWKTLDPKNKRFFSSNLLPSKIAEEQKRLKVGWHGFLVLIVIFPFAYTGTTKYLENNKKIVELGQLNYNLEMDLNRSRTLLFKFNELQNKLYALENNLKKIDELRGSKNQWYKILPALSNSLRNNRISWMIDLKGGNEDFIISGFTTNRRNVLNFSKLFPNNGIDIVLGKEVESVYIWKFGINFFYPNPEEVRKEIKKELPPSLVAQKANVPTKVEEINKASISMKENRASAASDYNEAVQIYLSGNLNEGYKKFCQFVTQYPSNHLVSYANYFIGECLFQKGEISEAEVMLKNTLTQEGSKTPDALMMLGRCCNAEGDTTKAIYYWNQLIDRFPDNGLSKRAKGKIKAVRER